MATTREPTTTQPLARRERAGELKRRPRPADTRSGMVTIVRFLDGATRRFLHAPPLRALAALVAPLAAPAALRAQSHGVLQATATVVDMRASDAAARDARALAMDPVRLPRTGTDGVQVSVERPRDAATPRTVVRVEFVQ